MAKVAGITPPPPPSMGGAGGGVGLHGGSGSGLGSGPGSGSGGSGDGPGSSSPSPPPPPSTTTACGRRNAKGASASARRRMKQIMMVRSRSSPGAEGGYSGNGAAPPPPSPSPSTAITTATTTAATPSPPRRGGSGGGPSGPSSRPRPRPGYGGGPRAPPPKEGDDAASVGDDSMVVLTDDADPGAGGLTVDLHEDLHHHGDHVHHGDRAHHHERVHLRNRGERGRANGAIAGPSKGGQDGIVRPSNNSNPEGWVISPKRRSGEGHGHRQHSSSGARGDNGGNNAPPPPPPPPSLAIPSLGGDEECECECEGEEPLPSTSPFGFANLLDGDHRDHPGDEVPYTDRYAGGDFGQGYGRGDGLGGGEGASLPGSGSIDNGATSIPSVDCVAPPAPNPARSRSVEGDRMRTDRSPLRRTRSEVSNDPSLVSADDWLDDLLVSAKTNNPLVRTEIAPSKASLLFVDYDGGDSYYADVEGGGGGGTGGELKRCPSSAPTAPEGSDSALPGGDGGGRRTAVDGVDDDVDDDDLETNDLLSASSEADASASTEQTGSLSLRSMRSGSASASALSRSSKPASPTRAGGQQQGKRGQVRQHDDYLQLDDGVAKKVQAPKGGGGGGGAGYNGRERRGSINSGGVKEKKADSPKNTPKTSNDKALPTTYKVANDEMSLMTTPSILEADDSVVQPKQKGKKGGGGGYLGCGDDFDFDIGDTAGCCSDANQFIVLDFTPEAAFALLCACSPEPSAKPAAGAGGRPNNAANNKGGINVTPKDETPKDWTMCCWNAYGVLCGDASVFFCKNFRAEEGMEAACS